MVTQLNYKGYTAKIHFTETDETFRGKVDNVKDLVNFEGNSENLLIENFHRAVDNYIAFCNSIGKDSYEIYCSSE